MAEMDERLLVDSLQKQEAQEEEPDAQGRFLKGVSGNPEGRYKPGESGNPAGRPPGTRNRATESAELLLEGEAEALTRKAVELALGGDPAALRLCLDRLIAPHRERLVAFALPRMREPEGVLAPAEAAELVKVVDTFAKAIEMRDFNSRLTALEKEYAEEP